MQFRRAFVPIGACAASLGLLQAWKVRKDYVANYRREEPLPGPHCGVENKVNHSHVVKGDGIYERGLSRIKLLLSKTSLVSKSDNKESGSNVENKNPRRIKLVILGDSLVFGVGCDNPQSIPIFPQFLAKVLSRALNADIEWISDGKVGATAAVIRNTLLPNIRSKLIDDYQNEVKEFTDRTAPIAQMVVIVVCGLNDWKEMLEKFPFGAGPVSFKRDLSLLVDEIKAIGKEINSPCKVFLPELPLVCTLSDPNCSFRVTPLYQLFCFICKIWDLQKHALAFDDPHESTAFIGPPKLDTEYAMPGKGNISKDGIHPTNQGYKWWAMHLAEAICLSIKLA